MDRKSIVAFVAIYALVAGIGFIASHQDGETPAQPATETVETKSFESASVNVRTDQQ